MSPAWASVLPVARTSSPEAEVRPDGNRLDSRPDEVRRDELLRRLPLELGRERRDERLRDTRLGEQLEPSLEGRDQVDAVPHRDARMGIERDHRRVEARVDEGSEDGSMTAMDAVERADRDRPRPALELRGCVRDPHGAAASRGSASSRASTRSSSASSTENGPISVRRSVTQWPPSRSAIERMYVPEPTRRSSATIPSA